MAVNPLTGIDDAANKTISYTAPKPLSVNLGGVSTPIATDTSNKPNNAKIPAPASSGSTLPSSATTTPTNVGIKSTTTPAPTTSPTGLSYLINGSPTKYTGGTTAAGANNPYTGGIETINPTVGVNEGQYSEENKQKAWTAAGGTGTYNPEAFYRTEAGTMAIKPGATNTPGAPLPTTTTTPSATPTIPAGNTTTATSVDSIVDQMFPKDKYSEEERSAMKSALSGKNTKEIADFMAKNEQDKYTETQNLLNAYRTTRDFGINAERTKVLNDQRVADLTQQYDNAIKNQKDKMEADANNMSVVQGTAGRLQSRNLQNAVAQMLDTNKNIYSQLVSNKDRDIQRLAEDLKYAQTIASNEYNDKISDEMKDMLSSISALDKTGSLATAQGLVQARSFIDATLSNTMQHQSDYYNKLQYISSRFDQYNKDAIARSTVDDKVTSTMGDGYLYNSQGLRVQNEQGQPIKVANSTGTLLTKEPIQMNDGSKAFVYQNPDGTTRVEKILGTEAAAIDNATIQKYAQAVSTGLISIPDLQKLGVPMTAINQIMSMTNGAQMNAYQKAQIDLEREKLNQAAGEQQWTKLNDTTLVNSKTGQTKTIEPSTTSTGGIGSDFTSLASKYPNVAAFKNNNPSGITWNANFANNTPGSLADRLTQAGIKFSIGTDRPSAEGGNYVKFNSIEDGLKATKLMWQISSENGQTIGDRLKSWSVAGYSLPGVKMTDKFSDLSEADQDDLIMKQLQHESPGLSKELANAGIFNPEGINYDGKKATIQEGGDLKESYIKRIKTGSLTPSEYGEVQKIAQKGGWLAEYNSALDKGMKTNLSPTQQKAYETLTDDITKSSAYTNMGIFQNGLGAVKSGLAQGNGLGDIEAINAFQRMVDPGATVREGDVSLIQSAIPLAGKVDWNYWYGKAKSGDKLPPEVRNQISKAAVDLYNSRAKTYNDSAAKIYQKRADSIGVDSSMVPGLSYPIEGTSTVPSQVTTTSGKTYSREELLNSIK